MSALSDELAQVKANLDATAGSLTSIAAGVLALDALIQQLQNTPGVLGPDDQAALDAIAAASAAVAGQAAAVSTAPPA